MPPELLSHSTAARWLLLWFTFVAVLSLVPLSVKQALHTIGPLHTTGHIVIFCISGILLLSHLKKRLHYSTIFMILLLFCAAMEGLQALIYQQASNGMISQQTLSLSFSPA